MTPDGKTALVSDLDAGELVVVDAVSGSVTRRIALGKQPEGVLISPDGALAFVAVNGDNVVAVVDLKTWHVSRLSPGNGPDGMAYVP